MLTEEEQAALERFRRDRHNTGAITSRMAWEDMYKLAEAMLRLFPPGHADEITPERLVACGGQDCKTHVSFVSDAGEVIIGTDFTVVDYNNKRSTLRKVLHPRNMGEAWQLLERCEIPVVEVGAV